MYLEFYADFKKLQKRRSRIEVQITKKNQWSKLQMFGFLCSDLNFYYRILFSRFFEIGIKFQIQKSTFYAQPQNFVWGLEYPNRVYVSIKFSQYVWKFLTKSFVFWSKYPYYYEVLLLQNLLKKYRKKWNFHKWFSDYDFKNPNYI